MTTAIAPGKYNKLLVAFIQSECFYNYDQCNTLSGPSACKFKGLSGCQHPKHPRNAVKKAPTRAKGAL